MTQSLPHALLSVYDKTDLLDVARLLTQRGWTLLSTGGTRAHLVDHGIDVVEVCDHTGSPEMFHGRVKTLHPLIHAGILARRDYPEDMRQCVEQGVAPIGVVVANLYPFEQVVEQTPQEHARILEHIDIGGPTMVRAAAKNHAHVVVLTHPQDYPLLERALDPEGGLPTRRLLAARAFARTARYERAIAGYFDPAQELRYGENPHQSATLRGGGAIEQLHGKALSYNNILDADAAILLSREFERPCVAIIKHTNPAGAACAPTLEQAYVDALACDAKSAFGGIVACNRVVDGSLARRMEAHFFEVIAAPGFSDEAMEVLTRKKNLRLLKLPEVLSAPTHQTRQTVFGELEQQVDPPVASWGADWEVVCGELDAQTKASLLFAWRVVKHVKSNAIVLAHGTRTVGVGAGQMSRVDAVALAIEKSLEPLEGSVLASDAFFPFADGPELAIDAGVRAIIQPGGSRRDAEVIQACRARGVTLVMTGRRHFRHG